LSRRGAFGSPAVLEYVGSLPNSVCAHLVGYQICLVENGSQGSAGRWQTDVLCPLVFGRSPFSQQLSFCSCCVIVGEVADTLRQKEIWASGWQLEVLCLHILWQVQVLPDACRSLPFSVLCVVF
jgi:hypothetical protein